MKKHLIVTIVAIAAHSGACGGTQPAQPGGGGTDPDPVTDTRTEIEKRRDAGCEALAPRLFQCVVDDSKAEVAAGRLTKAQFEKDTSPEMQAAFKQDWFTKCKRPMSSRQVRVLEVCFKEETECDPLYACLDNLKPAK
jgi:hypothetical protein